MEGLRQEKRYRLRADFIADGMTGTSHTHEWGREHELDPSPNWGQMSVLRGLFHRWIREVTAVTGTEPKNPVMRVTREMEVTSTWQRIIKTSESEVRG